MFLNPEEIRRLERLYGAPVEERAAFEMGEREWAILKESQLGGRAHDVTVYVQRGAELAVIAKHGYPPGVYRAPSGGVLPGESMEQGIAREMMEETGLEIRLRRYLLKMAVEFSRGGETVHWTTHVFTAEAISTRLEPQDLHEIREARWVSLQELSGPIDAALRASASAGLRYRSHLHRKVMEILAERG